MKYKLLLIVLLINVNVYAEQIDQIFSITQKTNDNSHSISISQNVNDLDSLSRLAIDLPEVGIQKFSVQKKYVTNKKQTVWLGKGSGHSTVSLIQSNYGLSGSIRTKQGIWQIRTDKDGNSKIIKFDKSQYQKTTDVLEPRNGLGSHKHSDSKIEASPASYNSTPFQTIQTQTPAGFTDSNDIRVLAYYSSEAIDEYPNLEDLIELEFADTNQAFVNSNIPATLTLAGFIEISDYGTENNLYDMLDRSNNFARMDEAKEKYDADLVHFFGENLGWVCGIAYYSADSTGWVDSEYGVGATVSNCLGTLTFAHEVGHNLGARHDRYVESGGTSDYAYGYVDLENRFQTLMSYRNNCSDNGKSCTEITHFSNPDINYNGKPTGVAITEAEAASNATLLQKTTPLVANYTGVGYPDNFAVSKGTEINKVTLSWDAMNGADGYELKRYQLTTACPDYNSLYTSYTTTTELSLTTDSTGDSSQYCYWLRAYKDYPHGARIYSAPTPVEIGYSSSRSTHISDIQPIHITDKQSVVTIDFTTNHSTTVIASIIETNASDWLTIELLNVSANQYQLTLTNKSEIAASAIVVIDANGTKEYLPVQFSGYTNSAPVINVEETVNIPQGGSISTNLTVEDDGGADKVILNYYSEDTSFISNSQISVVEDKLTVNLTHELTGSGSIMITAFDGELLTRKRITFNVVRSIYNPPHIPEEITLYVDGDKAITRLLPGYSIDADELSHSINTLPEKGELEISEGQFTYTPTNFSGTDVFILESQLVANGDDNMPQDVYQTRVNLVPFTQVQLPFQQYILGSTYSRFLLTHRGQLWQWGRKYLDTGAIESLAIPTLQLEGSWVDAAHLISAESTILLKADGTLWMIGKESFYDPESIGEPPYFSEPKQIGTDRDWQAIFEDEGSNWSGGILLLKSDGSLWVLGESWPLFGNDNYTNFHIPEQVNGLYHWQDGTKVRETFSLLDNQGVVWTLGNDRFKSLGRGRAEGIMGPVELSEKVTRLEGNFWRNFAYTPSGIYGWGSHLFLHDSSIDSISPVLLNTENWKHSSFSTYSFSAVTRAGELFTTSTISRAEMGRGENAERRLSKVGSDDDWVVSYGQKAATYAVKTDGSLWVAGENDVNGVNKLGINNDAGTKLFYFTKMEDFPTDTLGNKDTDNDGILNFEDIDDDNDCIIDSLDPEPDVVESSGEACSDTDGDGLINSIDEDDDNDGVLDENDAFPLDPNESVDTDNDGIGNNADTDDDNDGVLDENDAFPLDANESVDTDNDGIGNNADTDDDNDGVVDEEDAFPLDATESMDTDSDGIGNNADTDDDNDGIVDEEDAFPLDASESVDTDNDGIGNNADTDDDNDGIVDEEDVFPLDASESVDTDSDGIGNNADTDDDNDGIVDENDAFPLDASESMDTDNDGIGNNADTDDDNDGVSDATDAFPFDANESVDTDGDGIGNNADTDDDGDGVVDSSDAFPLDASRSAAANNNANDSSGSGGGSIFWLLVLISVVSIFRIKIKIK